MHRPMMKVKLPASLVSAAGCLLAFALCVLNLRAYQEKPQGNGQYEQPIGSLDGAELFRHHCAPCHGVAGNGGGPVASALKRPIPDLTTLAQRNRGVFPGPRVRQIVIGDEKISAHGSREMPIWGPVFHQIENDRDLGNVRLENILGYLQKIQKK